jgi:hypothetical protein
MNRVIFSAVALALLALACGEEEGITRPPPEYLPADVLESVQTSFDRRDINLLRTCLSPDFVFYFDPRDVGQTPPGSEYVIPESWSYTDFWKAANNLFWMAYAINLSIPTGGIRTPGENETTYKADNISISLLVMVDEFEGYKADQGCCDFAFEVYYNEKKEKRWRLVGWWDFTSEFFDAYPGVAPASLGRVLALFK